MASDEEGNPIPAQAFPATRWTLVLEAQTGDEDEKGHALDYLCQNYWFPIYAYARRRGESAEDAEDLTQGFFAKFFGERFDGIDFEQRPGKLRSYLLTAFKNYCANAHRHDTAQKRGGGQKPISLDAEAAEGWYQNEPADSVTPESLFERRWVLSLMEAAFDRLRADYEAGGKVDVFETLKDVLAMPDRAISYADIGAPLQMTAGAARVAAHRMRQRLKQLIRKEIEYTVASPEEVEAELRNLRAVLAM